MKVEQAIKKAIEGGWKPDSRNRLLKLNDEHDRYLHVRSIFLDPSFWQSLGKALEWKPYLPHEGSWYGTWWMEWHRFIDHLANGKDAEEFFEGLN